MGGHQVDMLLSAVQFCLASGRGIVGLPLLHPRRAKAAHADLTSGVDAKQAVDLETIAFTSLFNAQHSLGISLTSKKRTSGMLLGMHLHIVQGKRYGMRRSLVQRAQVWPWD